jgi:acylphosphatase
MKMKNVRIILKAKLRNTGFGFVAMYKAKKNNITGCLKYDKEGNAIIEAEGDDSVLDEFIAWCGNDCRPVEIMALERGSGHHKDFLLVDSADNQGTAG